MWESDNVNRPEVDGVGDYVHDDLYPKPPTDAFMFSRVDADDLPNTGECEDRLNKLTNGVDSPDEKEDECMSTVAQMNSSKFLACLLTCGSQRMNETMYNVVRKLLNSKYCSSCGSPVTGTLLPGVTYLKSKLKSSVRSLVAKHEIMELTVNTDRAGAKFGVVKYKSRITAPVLVVKPSEWARIDFSTPAVRKVIWKDVIENKNIFTSIEDTPVVRHRCIFPADNIVEDGDGLEHVVVRNDCL